jgi:hypothetical protein
MTEIFSSEWTPAAYKARDEQRRMREANEAALLYRDREVLVSDWTLAAFQQREEERRRREAKEALAALEKRMEERRHKEQAARIETPTTRVQPEVVVRVQEEPPDEDAASMIASVEPAPVEGDLEEARLVPEQAVVHPESARSSTWGISWILATSLIAAGIGFGAGVFFAPPKKAARVRALVDRTLVSIFKTGHASEGGAKTQPSKASQAKAPPHKETSP